MDRLQRFALLVILLSAIGLRLTGLNWDGFQHHHPDERYITWVATTIEFPAIRTTDWAAQWRPETSTFNPFHWPPAAGSEGIVVLQDQPRDFAYGHFPLYLGVASTRLVEAIAPFLLPLLPSDWWLTADVLNGASRIEFHHIAAVGRALTALFDAGTVLFIFLLGRRLYNPAAGLLAAAFTALSVIHIQLAHFFTSDPYLTFFVVVAIYLLVAARGESMGAGIPGSRRAMLYLGLAAIAVGLAIGSKFTAVLLFLPLFWIGWLLSSKGKRIWILTGLALVVFVTFAITNPFAVLDWTCSPDGAAGDPATVSSFLSRSCYLQNIMTQNAMVRGVSDLAFTRQYDGTFPYLYYFEMLLRWGMGPLMGIVGLAGLGWVTWDAARKMRGKAGGRSSLLARANQPVVTVLLWVWPYLLLTGSFYVKFLRYMQPIVPFMLLFGAAMIWQWGSPAGRRLLAGAILIAGIVYAVAFVRLYDDEHPWNAGSQWIYENVTPGSLILSEQWDDFLPVNLTVGDEKRLRKEYPNAELTWLTYPDAADNEANLRANLELLADAEYLTVLSNRIYGVVPRLPERYPLSSRYYQLLFDGALGYELVWVDERTPNLFGLSLRADTFGWPGLRPPTGVTEYFEARPGLSLGRADESFIVYDQPLTMIFRNTGRLSPEQLREAFGDLSDGAD